MEKLSDKDLLKLVEITGTFYGIYFCGIGRDRTHGAFAFGRWEWFAEKHGLSLGKSRSDAESLRRLTDAGYLTATGQTKGKSHHLTVNGWALGLLQNGITWTDLKKSLRRICANVEKSTITLPHSVRKIWIVQYDKPFDYEPLHEHAAVLIQLGLVRRYIDCDGFIWGLTTIDGATFPTPDAFEAHDCDREGEFVTVWLVGMAAGIAIAEGKPPKETDNILPRLLPCSKWW